MCHLILTDLTSHIDLKLNECDICINFTPNFNNRHNANFPDSLNGVSRVSKGTFPPACW